VLLSHFLAVYRSGIHLQLHPKYAYHLNQPVQRKEVQRDEKESRQQQFHHSRILPWNHHCSPYRLPPSDHSHVLLRSIHQTYALSACNADLPVDSLDLLEQLPSVPFRICAQESIHYSKFNQYYSISGDAKSYRDGAYASQA